MSVSGRVTAHDVAAFARDSAQIKLEALNSKDFFEDRRVGPSNNDVWFVDFFAPVSEFSFIVRNFPVILVLDSLQFYFYLIGYFVFTPVHLYDIGVKGDEVECRPCNCKVHCLIPRSGCRVWDCSLGHIFCRGSTWF